MDHAEAARDRLTLAARASKTAAGSASARPDVTAGGLLDAAIGIGHALLAVTDAIHDHAEAVTGPDGALDRLGVIGDHLDRMRGDVTDLARLANHR
jgi:hypothetical protein